MSNEARLNTLALNFGDKYDPRQMRELMQHIVEITRFNQKFIQMLRSGTEGQVLTKTSHLDFDAGWGAGGGGGDVECCIDLAEGQLAGRGSESGTGTFEAIFLGEGLAMVGNTLTNTGVPGPDGPQGPPGADGTDGTNGTNGTNGVDGTSILSGMGPPGGGLGNDGDVYVDLSTYDFYGPKTGGVWGAGTSLIGPAGADGVMASIVAGTGISVDSTDPANPIVSNDGVISVTAGTNVTVDNTDPQNPIVSASGGGAGALLHAGW